MARVKVKRITTTTHYEWREVDVYVAEVEIPDDTPLDKVEDAALEVAEDDDEDQAWKHDYKDRRNESGWEDEDEDTEYEFVEVLVQPTATDPAAWAAAHPIGKPEDHGLTQPALLPPPA